jgi:hypothetical protein
MDQIRNQINEGKQKQIFRESEVLKTLIGYLEENGWKVSEGIVIDGGLVDVGAERQGKIWLIEAKGEDKGGYTSAEMNFQMGLGQIMSRMKYREYEYALAFPMTSDFAKVLKKYRGSYAFEKLGVHFLIVREDRTCNIVLAKDIYELLNKI